MTAREPTPDEQATTIFVISYNYGHLLAEAVGSALAQDAPNVRVAVVDDGSTDDTAGVAARFAPAVAYLGKANGGLSDARNFAAARCETPLLLFLDADNTLPPEFVRVCLQELSDRPDASFVYTQLEYFGDQAGRSQFPAFDPERLKRGSCIDAGALLRTDVVREHPYDVRLRAGLEDWDFYLTLAEHGHAGVLTERTALNFRVHGVSMGHGVQRNAWRRRRTYLQILFKHRRFMGLSSFAGMARRSLRHRLTLRSASTSE